MVEILFPLVPRSRHQIHLKVFIRNPFVVPSICVSRQVTTTGTGVWMNPMFGCKATKSDAGVIDFRTYIVSSTHMIAEFQRVNEFRHIFTFCEPHISRCMCVRQGRHPRGTYVAGRWRSLTFFRECTSRKELPQLIILRWRMKWSLAVEVNNLVRGMILTVPPQIGEGAHLIPCSVMGKKSCVLDFNQFIANGSHKYLMYWPEFCHLIFDNAVGQRNIIRVNKNIVEYWYFTRRGRLRSSLGLLGCWGINDGSIGYVLKTRRGRLRSSLGLPGCWGIDDGLVGIKYLLLLNFFFYTRICCLWSYLIRTCVFSRLPIEWNWLNAPLCGGCMHFAWNVNSHLLDSWLSIIIIVLYDFIVVIINMK